MTRYETVEGNKEIYHIFRAKQELLGSHKPLSEVEEFKSNEEYIGTVCCLYLDLIADVKRLLGYPDKNLRDKLAREYQMKKEELKSKRKKSEEKKVKFSSTSFLEERDISEEEKTVVFLLLANNGIGVTRSDRTLIGEEILTALNITHDIPVEEGRRYLLDSSKLIQQTIIGSPSVDTPNEEIERKKFGISEFAISGLLGENERMREIESYIESRNPNGFSSVREALSALPSKKEENILEKLEVEVEPSDVILPQRLKKDIFATIDQVQNENKFSEWGIDEITGNRSGVALLFTGPSGTGKTMLGKAIGSYLDEDVYYLPFDKLLSCYYGETESNVKSVFQRLNEKEAVLIIDEAEGILNQRYSSQGAADSTENRVIDIFLREMEEHKGVMILTSNYSIEMDKALSRRIDLKVRFPEPGPEARKKIWENHIPDSLPLADDVDIDSLARRFEITGGEIKNAVLTAARRAIFECKDEVHQRDFIRGIRFERDNEAMYYSLKEDEDRLKGYS